jgi:hypothetical protein
MEIARTSGDRATTTVRPTPAMATHASNNIERLLPQAATVTVVPECEAAMRGT